MNIAQCILQDSFSLNLSLSMDEEFKLNFAIYAYVDLYTQFVSLFVVTMNMCIREHSHIAVYRNTHQYLVR